MRKDEWIATEDAQPVPVYTLSKYLVSDFFFFFLKEKDALLTPTLIDYTTGGGELLLDDAAIIIFILLHLPSHYWFMDFSKRLWPGFSQSFFVNRLCSNILDIFRRINSI